MPGFAATVYRLIAAISVIDLDQPGDRALHPQPIFSASLGNSGAPVKPATSRRPRSTTVKDLAPRPGPEPSVVIREDAGEASTGSKFRLEPLNGRIAPMSVVSHTDGAVQKQAFSGQLCDACSRARNDDLRHYPSAATASPPPNIALLG